MSQVSTAPLSPARCGRGNRRATVRYRCAPATLGKVYVSDDQEYQCACVVNLSAKGIGLQMSRPLLQGQIILISMRSNDAAKTYELSAQVAHCESLPLGDWYLGCELTIALSPEDLDQLL